MASGDTLVQAVGSIVNESVAAAAGTPDLRNGHPVIDLAVNDEIVLTVMLPQHYGGGGVTFHHEFGASSATTGNVKLQTEIERIAHEVQDIDADGYAAGQNSGDVAVPATSGHVKTTTTAHTAGAQMDSLAKGELARARIKRIAATASEAAGDCEYHGFELRES